MINDSDVIDDLNWSVVVCASPTIALEINRVKIACLTVQDKNKDKMQTKESESFKNPADTVLCIG